MKNLSWEEREAVEFAIDEWKRGIKAEIQLVNKLIQSETMPVNLCVLYVGYLKVLRKRHRAANLALAKLPKRSCYDISDRRPR